MKIFLDTICLEAISEYKDLVDGITTNPAFMGKAKLKQEEHLPKICALAPTIPISGEVIYANSIDQICEDGRKLAKIAPNMIVKVPGNLLGLRTIRIFKAEGIKTNVTGFMTFRQLAYASLLGADYVSHFYCRARDAGLDPVKEINLAKQFIEQNGLKTEIIVASLRKPSDVQEALLTRGDILTINPELLEETFTHAKTEFTIREFISRYEEQI